MGFQNRRRLRTASACTPGNDQITESALQLIQEKGLDPELIAGTGKDGRILKKDVLFFLASASEKSHNQEPIPPETGEEE